MKIAIVGSRKLSMEEIEAVIPPGATEIVTGCCRAAESAKAYALKHSIAFVEFYPASEKHLDKRKCHDRIVFYADALIPFYSPRKNKTTR